MANSQLLKRIANEVETLISQNRKAVNRFRDQLEVFNNAWRKYWSAKENEFQPLDERPDKSKKNLYEYDRDFKCWFPKYSPTLPPDPTKWELDDKLPCYYGTLAVVYDSVKSKVAPFMLCEGILGNYVFGYTQLIISRAWGFDKDMLDTALKWVKADLLKETAGTRQKIELDERTLQEVPTTDADRMRAYINRYTIGNMKPNPVKQIIIPTKKPTKEGWITITEAAKILGVNKGNASRWANEDKIKDNGKRGRERRISKVSVLLLKDKREREDLVKDAADILRDRASKIPDRH